MDAAMECFCQKGYHGSSLSDIMRVSGLSKGSIYWHFPSKEDIFLAVFEKWCEKALADLKEDFENDEMSVDDIVKNNVERMYSYLNEERSFTLAWLEFSTAACREERVRNRLNMISKRFFDALQVYLSQSKADGEIRDFDVPTLVKLMIAFHDGLRFNGVIWPEMYAGKEAIGKVVVLLNELITTGHHEDLEDRKNLAV